MIQNDAEMIQEIEVIKKNSFTSTVLLKSYSKRTVLLDYSKCCSYFIALLCYYSSLSD